MSRISLDTLVAKDSNQVIDRAVDDGALLINLHNGDYFSLNGPGARVWEHINGSRTVGDLVELVLAEYDADAEEVVADVLKLVNELASEGLVVAR